ncbi:MULTISPECIES: helix-turn-helix domain-containing protein [unclassified Parabacteroides]|uniref:helix-turn-helix domain-containing protein n=1 Tax=unclassified Parabacteroides TaxID=2649774 RepID=UPI0024745320|nr:MULTISPECIES: helix-turn-helix domain-containing protein [unclassified Parabacteroides]
MENNFNRLLLEAIEGKTSKQQKTKTATLIADILCIDKAAAYRRMRGEVSFTLHESILLAGKLNISLDDIVLKLSNKNEGPKMTSHYPQQLKMGLQEPWHIEQDKQFLETLTQQPYSEMGVALGNISSSLHFYYEYLARFYLLKYKYHLGDIQPFSCVKEAPLQVEYRQEFYHLYRKMSYTYYIWDSLITTSVTDDIRYFHHIGLITREEVELLKEDLHLFFRHMRKLADLGYYPDTGNKFELYISDTHIDVTYAYMWTEKIEVSMFTSFVILTTSSLEKMPFDNVSSWIKSLKRSAVQISVTNEKERIAFFNAQHAIVDTL